MSENFKNLIVVVGPTAVGKTAVAIELSRHFDTEIISADSRQVFRETEIGTAKPSREEQALVKHHFINSHSITESFNAADFEREALKTLDDLFKKYPIVFMVGGSGLYVDAVCSGMDNIPSVDENIRIDLSAQLEKSGLTSLQEMLKNLDSEYYNQVDLNNPQRIIRALEVCIGTGKPYSSFREKKVQKRSFNIIKIGLTLEREKLYERIDRRMDQMIEAGLFEEAQSLFHLRHLNALQTVGYSEIFDFIEGKIDRSEAIRLLKRNSRRYAKRQLTWFNKDKSIQWFDPQEPEKIKDFVIEKLKENG